MKSAIYPCGPLQVRIGSDPHQFATTLKGALNLYSAPWSESEAALDLHLQPARDSLSRPKGPYLTSARMSAWTTEQGLAARCDSGATAELVDLEHTDWSIGIPSSVDDIWTITDLENLMSLVLTTGWRKLGWAPFHAGLVCRPKGPAVLLCAPSGVGKTTLTLALVLRGWSTLGDDKLLMRSTEDGGIEARALIHTFNLFPHINRWFPELGYLTQLPTYSVWTDKRRVPITRLHPEAPRSHARPSHLVQILRSDDHDRIRITALNRTEILSTLIRQTVIPSHRATARPILDTIAQLTSQICGLRVEVGQDAYRDGACLAELEQALENTP